MLQSEKKWVECDHWMQEQTILYHEKYLQSVNNDVNNMPAICKGYIKPNLIWTIYGMNVQKKGSEF